MSGGLFLLADCPRQLQNCAKLWDICPFWDGFAELLHNSGGRVEIRLPGGSPLVQKKAVSVLEVATDHLGSTFTVTTGQVIAAHKITFKRLGALLSGVASGQDRANKLYAMVGAAFLYGSGGWTLSTAVWRRVCQQENRWRPRNMMEPWHSGPHVRHGEPACCANGGTSQVFGKGSAGLFMDGGDTWPRKRARPSG